MFLFTYQIYFKNKKAALYNDTANQNAEYQTQVAYNGFWLFSNANTHVVQ